MQLYCLHSFFSYRLTSVLLFALASILCVQAGFAAKPRRPKNVADLRIQIEQPGDLMTWEDTVLRVQKAVYATQMNIPYEKNQDYQLQIWNLSLDQIVDKFSHDKGGVCGNYAEFYARILYEVYGIPAWTFSMGSKNAETKGGHMQTLVGKVKGIDTTFYLMDANFNYTYLRKDGSLMPFPEMVKHIKSCNIDSIVISENNEMGVSGAPYKSILKFKLLNPYYVYDKSTYIENPEPGDKVYRYHVKRSIEKFSRFPDFVDVSKEYVNPAMCITEFDGNVRNFPMSIFWFRTVYIGPDKEMIQQKILSMLND